MVFVMSQRTNVGEENTAFNWRSGDLSHGWEQEEEGSYRRLDLSSVLIGFQGSMIFPLLFDGCIVDEDGKNTPITHSVQMN